MSGTKKTTKSPAGKRTRAHKVRDRRRTASIASAKKSTKRSAAQIIAPDRRVADTNDEPFDLPTFDPNDPENPARLLEALPSGPADKARALRLHHDEYSREWLLQRLHLALLARMPLDEIARDFGVSISTIYRWREKLDRRLIEQATKYDPHKLFTDSMENVLHARAIALREVASAKPGRERQTAVESLLRAEAAVQATLQNYGVMDRTNIVPEHQADEDPKVTRANTLIEAMHRLVTGDWETADPNADTGDTDGPDEQEGKV